jgi:probable phosphoglycerate mutase
MTPDQPWLVYSDGASRGNPGRAAIGAVVIDPSGGVRHEVSQAIGLTTNNVAEYRALVAGLEAALALGARRVEVRMDSELIVRQAIGRYRVLNPALIPLHNRVLALRSQFDEVVFRHVPRTLNKHADALANQALDRGA